MIRLLVVVIVLALVSGCAEESVLNGRDNHEPVPGEATPAPTDPRGGWAW